MLLALALLMCGAAYYGSRFSFDASSDTLVVQGDPDLAAYLRVSDTFGGDEFLLITFTPAVGSAFDADNLATLRKLQDALAAVEGVASVFSVLDVPLLESPPVPLAELAEGFRTLESADVDPGLARKELLASPVFRDLLITADGSATALRVDIALNAELVRVDRERARLKAQPQLTDADAGTLALLEAEHAALREDYVARREQMITDVRDVRAAFSDRGVIHIAGVPMIAADMIAFVKNDLSVFGGTVVAVIMITLYGFFRSMRWVLLPIATSAITIALTVGVLGMAQWPATVISSNFISLLAIITISLTIHLIVRYRELAHVYPDMDANALVRQTMVSKFAPCLYNALTTVAAFGSLTVSRIVPVEDFGWMMCIGIGIGFVVSFTFFPAVLRLLGRAGGQVALNQELGVTRTLSHVARWRSAGVAWTALVWALLAAGGISLVSMDNRFIDYFKDHTDIARGMHFVDSELGGTVPFDVVLRFAPYEEYVEEDDDFFADEAELYPERYWFTRDKLDALERVHRYVDSRQEVGKVLSLASLEALARRFTEGEPLTNIEIAAVLDALPGDLREELIRPYASPATGELRINARVIESGPPFDRERLAAEILAFATTTDGFSEDSVEVTGMMVLFNSMLKQLLSSQLDTLAYVLIATFAMFLILLRSLLYAVLGLIPNILAAASVIGLMGYLGIPLDMMTITIAAISIGIGVDDAIHYLHRFNEEYADEPDVRIAVAWSHATIGRAMYFTSVTIIIGFSVLVFSNFVPTVLFGLLTAAAMALALLANLTLLPSLLVLVLAGRRRGGATLDSL